MKCFSGNSVHDQLATQTGFSWDISREVSMSRAAVPQAHLCVLHQSSHLCEELSVGFGREDKTPAGNSLFRGDVRRLGVLFWFEEIHGLFPKVSLWSPWLVSRQSLGPRLCPYGLSTTVKASSSMKPALITLPPPVLKPGTGAARRCDRAGSSCSRGLSGNGSPLYFPASSLTPHPLPPFISSTAFWIGFGHLLTVRLPSSLDCDEAGQALGYHVSWGSGQCPVQSFME